MKSGRPERVASAVRQELATMLLRETKDPRLVGIVLTEVKVSPDLRVAWVRYELHDTSEEGRARARDGLAHAENFMRQILKRKLSLRYIPELRFEFDDRMMAVEHIDSILRDARPPSEDEPGEEDE